MKNYRIEFWYRLNNFEKDFDVCTIEAISFKEAVWKLKQNYPNLLIFKTEMRP